jgi:hypothetical protein
LNALLVGAVDTHVHSSPDVVPRRLDDRGVTAMAADAGLRAIVLKNHHGCTAARATLAQVVCDNVRVLGGLVLNNSACGGFNADAVRVSLKLGGKVVWMPTVSAANHIEYMRQHPDDRHVVSLGHGLQSEGLTPLRNKDTLGDDVLEILDLIAEADAVLATGHLSALESCVMVTQAFRRGVSRVLITHPEAPQIAMPREIQCDLAGQGAMLERCYYSLRAGYPAEEMLSEARACGIESTVFATDLGQVHNPLPTDGLLAFHNELASRGLTEDEWWRASAFNPSELLGLEKESTILRARDAIS